MVTRDFTLTKRAHKKIRSVLLKWEYREQGERTKFVENGALQRILIEMVRDDRNMEV